MVKKREEYSYGKGQIPHFRSPEERARYFDKLKREQEKRKKEGKGEGKK